jgi:putative hydrolase of the HAD superfamily
MVKSPRGLALSRQPDYATLMRADLAHIDSWIFDLDNTLYPSSANLFALIDERMGAFIMKLLDCNATDARTIQKTYFLDHGTTLAGLMRHHGTDPTEFLDYVHDIALDRLAVDLELVAHVESLPGRKLVFTNGDAAYAARVLDRLGLANSFDVIHDIHATAYRPKPDPVGYEQLRDVHAIDLSRAVFFEDMARNLKPAKALGMATVWIDNGSEAGHVDAHADHIDYTTNHLTPFLANILGA